MEEKSTKCHLKWDNLQECCKPIALRNLLSNSTPNQLPWETFYQTPNELLFNFQINVSTSCSRFLVGMNWRLDSVQWHLKKLGEKKIVGEKKDELLLLLYFCLYKICVCVCVCVYYGCIHSIWKFPGQGFKARSFNPLCWARDRIQASAVTGAAAVGFLAP